MQAIAADQALTQFRKLVADALQAEAPLKET